MDKKEVTGEWIKEQCDFAYKEYSELQFDHNTFVLNPAIKELNSKIEHYRAICPHKFNSLGVCIYCKTKEG